MKHVWWYQGSSDVWAARPATIWTDKLPQHTQQSFATIPIQHVNQVCSTVKKLFLSNCKMPGSNFTRKESKFGQRRACWDKQHVSELGRQKKKSCFLSSLGKRTSERSQLSWWWIRLLVRTWQVFVVNIILSASPPGSLQMQIPVSAVFYDTCSCFPGRPRQVSRWGLANQDGKRGMGGQVGLLSCQRCLSSSFTVPPPPPSPPPSRSCLQLCRFCSHHSFS